MTMEFDINDHLKLLKREYLLQLADFEKLLSAQAIKLREKGDLYFSQFSGIDKNRGNIILKLSSKYVNNSWPSGSSGRLY